MYPKIKETNSSEATKKPEQTELQNSQHSSTHTVQSRLGQTMLNCKNTPKAIMQGMRIRKLNPNKGNVVVTGFMNEGSRHHHEFGFFFDKNGEFKTGDVKKWVDGQKYEVLSVIYN